MTATTIIRYQWQDILCSKWVLLYGLFFLLLTDALFRFGGGSARVILSLTNVVLIVIPLMGVLFGTLYLYQSREFIELMLSQPIRRRTLFSGLYAGLSAPLALAFAVGTVVPFLIHGVESADHRGILALLVLVGVVLTVVFTALAFLISLVHVDRVTGMGVAIFTWLLFTVIFDGMVLLGFSLFQDFPLERPAIATALLNPVDLARILILLKLDGAALMGYTGAVFERFFGDAWGSGLSAAALATWCLAPLWLGLRRFARKDF